MAERSTQITCSSKGEVDSTEYREKEFKVILQENKEQEEADILTHRPTSKLKPTFRSKPKPTSRSIVKGIMKEACISERGEQLCSGCCVHGRQTPNLSIREMINSLKCCCSLIERGCKWLGTLESCENHLDTCGYVYETCKLNCRKVLRREELERHEKENCLKRQVKCDHCDENFISRELDRHLKKCPKMKVSCILVGCGTKITREEMELHLKHDCGMVQEMCKLGCGVELTRVELVIHEKENCPQRQVKCDNCDEIFKSLELNGHLEKCPKMKVSCDLCSEEKYRKDMTQHLEDDCPEKMVYCPFVKYKCLARMKRKDIAKHLEEKEIKHLGLKLTAMEDLITEQSEIINKQNKEISNASQQIELLYFITNTTKITWKIEDVRYSINYLSISKQYEVTGYSFAFMFHYGSLSIVFPGTTIKTDRSFIAKCQFMLHSCHTIYSGTIEVKQKDVRTGCEKSITYISKEDINKYSEPKFPGATKKDLTLKIYITVG